MTPHWRCRPLTVGLVPRSDQQQPTRPQLCASTTTHGLNPRVRRPTRGPPAPRGGPAAGAARMGASSSTAAPPWLTTAPSSAPAALAAATAALAVLVHVVRRLTVLRGFYAIPSPPGAVPILGHILHVMMHGPARAHELFLRWHEAYGPTLRIRLLHRTLVLIADAGDAAQVLGKGPNECFARTPEYTTFDVAHGMPGGLHAIMTEQDEARWKAVRRTIAPAYGPAAIREAFPAIVSCYASLAQRIAGIARSSAAESNGSGSSSPAARTGPKGACIDEEIFAATVCVMAQGMLRMDLQQLQQQFDMRALAADVGSLVAITNTFLSQPWKQWGYLACPALCRESRAFHAQRNHVKALTAAMAAHVERFRAEQLPQRPEDASLVACLARLREPSSEQPFSTQALQAELFLETVGQEAIPWTAAWMLYLLTQHPDAEARVVQELQGAGVPCNGDVAAAAAAVTLELAGSRASLPFCTAVLKEAMRMYPAGVAASPRMCHQATRVGRYTVPAGVIVFPCMYSIHMYSANFDDPHEFRPARWLQASSEGGVSAGLDGPSFMPFSVGPKACVAQQLAYVELKVLLALLVSCFSWRLAPCMDGPEGVAAQCMAALELRVQQGMWLVPTRRQ